MSLLRDYTRQAQTYDETRSASPSVLGPLREALAGAPGPRLADIGGGTGNYSRALREEGWDPVVVDREPAMLARAAAKGLETVEADARRLPLADASVDAAMLVSMLHHVEEPAAALAEARRILRPGGRLALMVFTREDIADMWLTDYFPSTRAWMLESHPTLAELLAMLPGARRIASSSATSRTARSPRWRRTPSTWSTRPGTGRRATSSASSGTTRTSWRRGWRGCGGARRRDGAAAAGAGERPGMAASLGERQLRPRPRGWRRCLGNNKSALTDIEICQSMCRLVGMNTRTLGTNGPAVSAIGLGCMGMSDLYGPADRDEGIATIHAALDAGITLLDTGDFYGMGHNELLIRDALATPQTARTC